MNDPITSTHLFSSFIYGFPSLNNQQKKALTITTVAVAVGCFALYYHIGQTQILNDKSKKITINENDREESESLKSIVNDSDHVIQPISKDVYIQRILQDRNDVEAYLQLVGILSEGETVKIHEEWMSKEALHKEALRLTDLLKDWEQPDFDNAEALKKNESPNFYTIIGLCSYLKSKIFGNL